MNEFNAVSAEELAKVEGGGWLDVLDTVLTVTSPIYNVVKLDQSTLSTLVKSGK